MTFFPSSTVRSIAPLFALCWTLGAVGPSAIPLCPGLTIVTAISDPKGDYESIKTVESVTDKAVNLRYSSERHFNGTLRRIKVQRAIDVTDLQNAILYLHHFDEKVAIRIPGSTAIGTSAGVLRALNTKGEAQLAIIERTGSASPVDKKTHPNLYDYQMVETIRRVGSRMYSVTVNEARVELPAIHAHGDYYGDKADFLFLDDERNPLTLKFRIGTATLDVVKIAYRCSPDASGPAAAAGSGIERALAESGRADIYAIFFSFNSDEIREESAPTLAEIAGVLKRHPDWKLAINGHTDNIASDTYNLQLSRRRAEAVKGALVSRYGIVAARLATAGLGEASPKDTNDTLEGRARNRRVELVKQ
jgi:outer membrane protein OmpA-like peptidoglycan-associated protein